MRKVLLPLIALLTVAACGQPGDLPLTINPYLAGKGISYDYFGTEMVRPIKIVCYIDTDKYNPLNALDYSLKDSGLMFFDYVILGGALLRLDAKGYYLEFKDSFKIMFAQRKKYIEPLQNRGIKVLLGIKSEGDASFGHLDDDKMYAFSDVLYKALNMYRLDGVEFFDDADPSTYPNIGDYYDGRDGFEEVDGWLAWQWVQGGRYFNNVFYILRQIFYNKSSQTLPDDTRRRIRSDPLLFVRENKFGRMLSNRFYVSEGYDEFSGSNVEITASFNPFFDRFPQYSSLIATETTPAINVLDNAEDKDNWRGDTWMPEEQYGPLAIDLDGGAKRNIFYQSMKDADKFGIHGQGADIELGDLYSRFRVEGIWEYIFFNNLKSIDEAKDPYYRWVWFDPNKPPSRFDLYDWDEDADGEFNPEYVPLPFVFDALVRELFNDRIVCTGGNHVKDW